jgi:putative ABC transport system ATP-binding protein
MPQHVDGRSTLSPPDLFDEEGERMLIEGRQLGFAIGDNTVFDDVTITCAAGEMTALVGPSGCGKTTLLHCLGLLQRPTYGRVCIDGTDATGWSETTRRKFWRNHAAFVQQDYGAIDDEAVAFNVTMQMSFFGRRLPGDRTRLSDALQRAGLPGREDELAAHLSGGEKQRLAIARAIYKRADVVFADEPTASLDQDNQARITDLFKKLTEGGTAVVIATHDERLAAACDNVYDLTHETSVPTRG